MRLVVSHLDGRPHIFSSSSSGERPDIFGSVVARGMRRAKVNVCPSFEADLDRRRFVALRAKEGDPDSLHFSCEGAMNPDRTTVSSVPPLGSALWVTAYGTAASWA